jgi:hypothetical protein
LQPDIAQVLASVVKQLAIAYCGTGADVHGNPVANEPIDEPAHRLTRWIDRGPALRFLNKPRAFNLCLALIALE